MDRSNEILRAIGATFSDWLRATFLNQYTSVYDPSKKTLYFNREGNQQFLIDDDQKNMFNQAFDKYYKDNFKKLLPNVHSYEIVYLSDYKDGAYHENGDIAIIFRTYEPQTETLINTIPTELTINIAIGLTNEELDGICLSNKSFRNTCKDNEFWRNLIVAKFQSFPPPEYSTSYDYRKIYYTLNQCNGDLECIFTDIMNFRSDISGEVDKVYASSLAEIAKYLYNTNPKFARLFTHDINDDESEKEKVSNNISNLLIVLVTSGNISSAKRLSGVVEFDRVHKIDIVSTLIDIFTMNQEYHIINFLLYTFPKEFELYSHQLLNGNALSEPIVTKLLSDPRITESTKDDILLRSKADALSPEEYNRKIALYKKTVNMEFLERVVVSSAGDINGFQLVKYILKTYRTSFTVDNLENIYDELKEHDIESSEIIYAIFGQPQMREKYGEL